jgi:hypothetical protein
MSIVAMKRKSVIQYGTHISARKPGGVWIFRGPHGKGQVVAENDNGFSINGTHRNKGAVGTPMAFSKTKTLFRGPYPRGWGGLRNTYYDVPLCVVNQALSVPGTQYKYVKPSVLSTRGMLHTRYKWAYNGSYPNYWVKNVYTGDLVDNASQGVYLYNKTSSNSCTRQLENQINPISEEDYMRFLTKRCTNPLPHQKHLPDISRETVSTCVV